MTNDEAKRIARDGLNMRSNWQELNALYHYILSGDMKLEIENAAYDQMAKKVHEHQVFCLNRAGELRDPQHRAARQEYEFGATVAATVEYAIRELIQPPAQKENGE